MGNKTKTRDEPLPHPSSLGSAKPVLAMGQASSVSLSIAQSDAERNTWLDRIEERLAALERQLYEREKMICAIEGDDDSDDDDG